MDNPQAVRPDGRTFVGMSNSGDGDVGGSTRFTYHQDGTTVWAEYAGGAVARGYLVGTRTGDALALRDVHLDRDGGTASGRCTPSASRGAGGRQSWRPSS